ncbi:hypothetical protein QBC39DRAFT_150507 [Podospora conica]|nr:hypothetical protein QBC39DRAFT_150507 [Schizothecium conicum]
MSGSRSPQQQQDDAARVLRRTPRYLALASPVPLRSSTISNRDGSWCVGAGEIVHSASPAPNSPLTLDINAARNHMLWCPNGSPFMPLPSLSLRRCVSHSSLIGQAEAGRGSDGSELCPCPMVLSFSPCNRRPRGEIKSTWRVKIFHREPKKEQIIAETPLAPCRSRARERKPQRKEGGWDSRRTSTPGLEPGRGSAAKGVPRRDRRGGEGWFFSTELHPEVSSVM